MSHFQNTHITEAGYFGIPFPQSTPREIKSSFLGVVMRGGQRVRDGAEGTGAISACCMPMHLCTMCLCCIFSVPNIVLSRQHPLFHR